MIKLVARSNVNPLAEDHMAFIGNVRADVASAVGILRRQTSTGALSSWDVNGFAATEGALPNPGTAWHAVNHSFEIV